MELSDGYLKRFGGIERLYTRDGLLALSQAHAIIIGVGGVGSWAAEGLARTGVGKLTLIDMDDVCLSNSNRQLPAMTSTVGKTKIEVIAKRLMDINPELELVTVFDFVTAVNVSDYVKDADVLIDAVDGLSAKCAILAECVKKNIQVVTVGAGAGKVDPTQIEVKDLGHTTYDFLLKRVRKKLRTDYQFPEGKKSTFGIQAVFSQEAPLYSDGEGGVCEAPIENASQKLDCQTGFGTSVAVTGTMGLVASSVAVKLILTHADSQRPHSPPSQGLK